MRKKTLCVAALTLIGLMFYAHTASYDFVYDDNWTIVHNAELDRLRPIARFFFDAATSATAQSGIQRDVYRPLSTFSFALNKRWAGLRPIGFRVPNIFLHLINALLLFALLSRWRSPLSSFLGASIFLAHPLQVESVVWVTQRSNLICAFGVMIALWAWTAPSRTWKETGLTVIGYAIALWGKETAIGLPLILWAAEWRGERTRPSARVWILIPIAVAFVKIRQTVFGRWGQDVTIASSMFASFVEGAAALSLYIRTLLWPLRLNVSLRPPEGTLLYVEAVAGLCLLLTWIGVLVSARKREPTIFFGLLTAFVFWLPHSGVVRLVTFAADRFMYLPLIGMAIVCGAVSQNKRAASILALFILFSGVLTFQRTFDWKTEASLWQASLRANPDNYFALGCYGVEWERKGDDATAESYYEKSLEHRPTVGFAKNMMDLLIQLNHRQNDTEREEFWKNKRSRSFPEL